MDKTLLALFDLTGRTAIVTGVSRGLGVSFARGLAKAGCDLAVSARTFDELQQVARELETFGHKVIPVRADVSRAADVETMVSEAVKGLGHIDILVNNAGTTAVADAEHMTLEQWQSVIDTVSFCAPSLPDVKCSSKDTARLSISLRCTVSVQAITFRWLLTCRANLECWD